MAKNEPKTNKENSKNKKSFFKGFKAELKKVTWPTPKQLVNNTIAVITIVLITAAIVFVLDLAFESINKYGVDKVKAAITASDENTTETNEVDENPTDESNDENATTEEPAEEENLTTITENTTEQNVESNEVTE